MRLALQVGGLLIALPLELMIIAALLRGGYRRFPFVFLYMIVNFLTTVVEIPSELEYLKGITPATTALSRIYWLDEVIEQVLVYVVVISLIYEASRKLRSRRLIPVSLVAGASLVAAISFYSHYRPELNQGTWMTPWMRDLNFCSVILDLGLWALLIASRRRDHQLLLLSGGLGIEFTGESIGESVRQLAIKTRSRSISLTGSFIMMLANLLFLFIWWQAVRAPRQALEPALKREEPPSRPGGSLKLP